MKDLMEFKNIKASIHSLKTLQFWMIVAILFLNIASAFFWAKRQAINIPTFHLDGTYQTASGLFRLASGEWPGKDFFPYLGIGILYYLYPVFRMLGKFLSSSVFTSYFLVVLSRTIGVGLLAALMSPKEKRTIGVILGSLFLNFCIWKYPYLPFGLSDWITPGNSLRPLRAFIPYLVALVVYVVLQSKLHKKFIIIILGVTCGLSFFWSNDFGIPTAFLIVMFLGYWSIRHKKFNLKNLGLFSMIAVCSGAVFLFLVTNGHSVDLLKYNFMDVRNDQYWFFAPWDKSSRILSVSDLFTKFFPELGWWGLVLLVVGALTIVFPTLELTLISYIGLSLFMGISVASIGGHLGYMDPLIQWCQAVLFIAILLTITELLFRANRLMTVTAYINQYIGNIGLITTMLLGLGSSLIEMKQYQVDQQTAYSDPNRFFVNELGGFLPIEWKKQVNLARENKESTYLEEYWGIWSAVNGKSTKAPVDALIHALGHTRNLYLERAFTSLPDYIITTPSSLSPWQAWSLSANWWFYRSLLQNYTPEKTSPSTLLWKKSAKVNWPSIPCSVNQTDSIPSISLSTGASHYYEVTMNYQITGSDPRAIWMVRNNINYVLQSSGYLSIDPNQSTMVFPAIAIKNNDKTLLDFTVVSENSSSTKISVTNCSAKEIIFSNPEVIQSFDESTPYNLTDENWVNGVRRTVAGFFVENNPINAALFYTGGIVKFVDGETRVIQIVRKTGPYIEVYLDGDPLDGLKVGYPNKIVLR